MFLFFSQFLQTEKKSSPFTSIACQKLMEKIKKWADENNYSIEEFNFKNRIKNIVCKTFHGAGIVVPYDKRTQLGYRKLTESDGKCKNIFFKLHTLSCILQGRLGQFKLNTLTPYF